MTIATIKYDLSDEDDALDYKLAAKSRDMSFALWKISQAWKAFKHSEKSQEFHDGVEAMNELICEALSDYDININELSS
jgi:hypothetical protein